MRQQDSKNQSDANGLAALDTVDPIAHKIANLRRKFTPSRVPNMSPGVAGMVGFVLDVPLTNPELAGMTVRERENLVYTRRVGAVDFDGVQSFEDLRNNWNGLMDASGLTAEERNEAMWLFWARVRFEAEMEP